MNLNPIAAYYGVHTVLIAPLTMARPARCGSIPKTYKDEHFVARFHRESQDCRDVSQAPSPHCKVNLHRS
jgi:hypothetical protein